MTVGPSPAGSPTTPDVVVVGASAGGLESLRAFLGALPVDLPAVVLVVLHVAPAGPGVLPDILGRVSRLPVSYATEADDLHPGRVLVAPADRHLVVGPDGLRLSRGPRENGHRPAVDVLFRSAARTLDARVVAVVLSGSMDDGTAGAVTVDQRGGAVLAQDPAEAAYPTMPASVLANVRRARPAGAAGLAAEVDRLCRRPLTRPGSVAPEVEPASTQEPSAQAFDPPGVPAGFGCPECSGALFQIEDGHVLRFRCRVGHAWTAAGLLQQQAEAMEGALWMALRGLEEKAALSRQLAQRAQGRGHLLTAGRFGQQAEDTVRSADLLRRLIDSLPAPSWVPPAGTEAVVNDV